MTIRESRGPLAGQKLCFVGDGSNMANSLIVGGLLAGMQVTCVCPEAYRPAADVLMLAHKYGSAFHFTSDPVEGVRDADVVATAVWNTAAPGTAESEQRLRDFVGFQLTGKLLEAARPDAMVLPACPPTGARRSPPPCSSSTRTRSLTRRRTVSTSRKPCWRCCWPSASARSGLTRSPKKSSTSPQAAWGRRSQSRCSRPPAISAIRQ